VPALVDHNVGVTVYESLAICVHLAERYPESGLYPTDPGAKALCLSAAAEMHAGFIALRNNCPMHCTAKCSQYGAIALAKPEVQEDIRRLDALWTGLISRYGNGKPDSFLFGDRPTIADVMYAPVAIRFKAYDPNKTALSIMAQSYVDTLLNMEGVQEWIADAENEGPELNLPQYEKYNDK
jgi:glutathione S-transferase